MLFIFAEIIKMKSLAQLIIAYILKYFNFSMIIYKYLDLFYIIYSIAYNIAYVNARIFKIVVVVFEYIDYKYIYKNTNLSSS